MICEPSQVQLLRSKLHKVLRSNTLIASILDWKYFRQVSHSLEYVNILRVLSIKFRSDGLRSPSTVYFTFALNCRVCNCLTLQNGSSQDIGRCRQST